MARVLKEIKCFGGVVRQLSHASAATKTQMGFTVFLPPAAQTQAVPALFWLSGLTCTDENFTTKAGAQRAAADAGVALVMPDTSPRGADVAGEDEAYDFGTGAGFYLNATQDPWSKNYNMYDYVLHELPSLVQDQGIDTSRLSISGHSMGGHGALTIGLKNPSLFASVSAFSPICNPMQCEWGQKAFLGYLGENKEAWKQYDACELATQYTGRPQRFLVDQGGDDEFLHAGQLRPESLQAACDGNDALDVDIRMRSGYDHSYFFIASFIDEHIRWHAEHLSSSDVC